MPETDSFHLDTDSLSVLSDALRILDARLAGLPPLDQPPADSASMAPILAEVAERMQRNYPYFHPLYAGQMLKPPHPVARLAYALAMFVNPNNHALDGGLASSEMERESVAEIAAMFGWKEHLGHLTSGGTFANLEALWVAGRLKPGEKVVASDQAHYTHERISGVLRLEFEAVASDRFGRMDAEALETRLRQGGVGTVVATIGTTAAGAVDPLPRLLELRQRYGFQLHADAAYGGYFGLTSNLDAPAAAAYARLGEVDSLVIDPHKHGMQPYGCGCVLFRDPSVGRLYEHDSPYTYFTSSELHLGEISLECSRPGASAVALWATQRLMPLVRGGEFAERLEAGRAAALALYARLQTDPRFITPFAPELDIVVWAPRAATASAASAKSQAIFDRAAERNLHLALARMPARFFDLEGAGMEPDQDTITCLRSVLMKPEHLAWLDRIWSILDESAR